MSEVCLSLVFKFELFYRAITIYGTTRFKLDRKSRVVMRAHAMRVISLTFSSASTRKLYLHEKYSRVDFV